MARGTVVGEAVVSQASTDEYRTNHERALGEKQPGQRGRWVWDEEAKRLVRADEYVPPPSKCGTTVVSGRWHEGMKAPDGTPIDTPAKRRAWMKATGVADYDDFKGARERRAKEIAEKRRVLETGKVEKHDPELRHFIGKQLYQQKVIL